MGIKRLKPTSPARRYQTYLTRDDLTPGATPEKSLLEPKKRISGRNNDGRITIRRRGGGHKRFYRVIDFKRDKAGIPGKVSQIEYDPNRSAHIALITYLDGEKRYIISPIGLKVGATILSGEEAERYGIRLGDRSPRIWDLANFFAGDEMLSRIGSMVKIPVKGLKVVCYYGCQASRPPIRPSPVSGPNARV